MTKNVSPIIILLVVLVVCSLKCLEVNAFSFFGNTRVKHSLFQSKDTRSLKPPVIPPSPPRNPRVSYGDFDEDDFRGISSMLAMLWSDDIMNDHDKEEEEDANKTLLCRGGNEEIIAGTKSTLQTTLNYWSNSIKSIPQKIGTLMDNINPFAKRVKNKSDEDEIDLTAMIVQNVEAPESTVLSDKTVRSAAQRSGLLGGLMRSDRVKECANQLKKFYLYRGYVLHSVTGATLHAENATATLTVYEPRSADQPLDIRFAKLLPIDPDTGETTTMRKYKAKLEMRKRRPLRPEEWNKIKNELNTTLIEAKGRTNPRIISKRLGLKSGEHFRWDGQLWQNIAQSGIFTRVFKANPVKLNDGSVQFQVIAQEGK